MQWQPQDDKDSRVVRATGWIKIDEYKKHLEPRAGVYVFADDNSDVKYVGKAGGGRMVVESDKDTIEGLFEVHSALYRKKDAGATVVKALYTNSDRKAWDLEHDLIKKYDPPNNGIDLLKD